MYDRRYSVLSPVTRLRAEQSWVRIREWQEIFRTFKTSRTTLGSTQRPIQWVQELTSSLFSNVTQHWLVVIDVSGRHIGPIFSGQTVKEESILTTNQRHVRSQTSEDSNTLRRKPEISHCTGVLPRGQSGRGVKLTTHFHPVARFRMNTLSLYAFMTWRGKTLI
jgi:hypothetical protein